MIEKQEFFNIFSTGQIVTEKTYKNLYFSKLSMDGLEEMHKYSSDKRLYEYFEFDVFNTLLETKQYIEKQLGRMSCSKYDQKSFHWFVRRSRDDRLIGTAGLTNLNYERKSIEWGYGVDPDLWGTGYILQIQECLKAYVFKVLGLNRLHGITMVGNQRTIESVLASGAVHEGTIRDYYCKNGNFIDGWKYSILAKDYFNETNRTHGRNNVLITNADILKVLREIMPLESIDTSSSMENTPSWDSLNHMNIMIGIKEKFGINFSPAAISRAVSVTSIMESIKEKDFTIS